MQSPDANIVCADTAWLVRPNTLYTSQQPGPWIFLLHTPGAIPTTERRKVPQPALHCKLVLTSRRFCVAPNGDDVEIALAAEEGEHGDEHADEHAGETAATGGQNCHFHAGVE